MALLIPSQGTNPDGSDNVRRVGARRPAPTAPNGEVIGDLWYNTADLTLRAWNGSIWQVIGGSEAIMPPARVGPSPAGAHGSGFASFDHTGRAYTTPGKYVLLADVTNTFLNAPTGGTVFIRINNADKIYVDGNGTNLSAQLFARDNFYNMRSSGDNNHRINYDGALNGVVISSFDRGGFFRQAGGGYVAEFGINGNQSKFAEASIGTWTAAHANMGYSGTVSHGGGNPFGYMMRNDGHCWIGANSTAGSGVTLRLNGTDLMSFSNSGGASDIRFSNLPVLGGNTMIWASGSGQVGHNGSSLKMKDNIRSLAETEDLDSGINNPVFKLRPARFNWKQYCPINAPRGAVNADEFNARCPNGFAGLIAEEVLEVCPDAVIVKPAKPEWHWTEDSGTIPETNEDGELILYRPAEEEEVFGLDNDRLVAYLVDAVQYLKEEDIKNKNEIKALKQINGA